MSKIYSISAQTRNVLTGILIIVVVSIFTAFIYYRGINKSEDPRVVQTKFLFRQYDEMMKDGNFSSTLPLLDTIESIFTAVPGYSESYEPGIIYNNRASAYLGTALYSTKDSSQRSRLLELARENIDTSILIYTRWLDEYGSLSENELEEDVKSYFKENENAFTGLNYRKLIGKRIKDLLLAQKESSRRLSVCYTNLGIILRHQYKQDEAVENYIKAIKLWKENFTARNNFNVLMGKQPEDRSIINQLFPPDKKNFN